MKLYLSVAIAMFAASPVLAQNDAAPVNDVAVTAPNAVANNAAGDVAAVPDASADAPAPAPAPPPPKPFPWGVLGLLGLIGLIGSRKSAS